MATNDISKKKPGEDWPERFSTWLVKGKEECTYEISAHLRGIVRSMVMYVCAKKI